MAAGGGGTGGVDGVDGDGDGSGRTVAAQHARGQYICAYVCGQASNKCAGRQTTCVRAGREGRGTRLQ